MSSAFSASRCLSWSLLSVSASLAESFDISGHRENELLLKAFLPGITELNEEDDEAYSDHRMSIGHRSVRNDTLQRSCLHLFSRY